MGEVNKTPGAIKKIAPLFAHSGSRYREMKPSTHLLTLSRACSLVLRPISVWVTEWHCRQSARRLVGLNISLRCSAGVVPLSTGMTWCTSVAADTLPSWWHRWHKGCAASISARKVRHCRECIILLYNSPLAILLHQFGKTIQERLLHSSLILDGAQRTLIYSVRSD